jgi:threonine dehydrogenase-like Zn-dependent dehydrogenase
LWDKDRLDGFTRQVLKQGIVNTRSMITHRYSFEQAPEAYQMIEQQPGEVIQVLFQYEKERSEHV